MSQICSAVSNRVISDVAELKKLGFELTITDDNAEGLLSLLIISPKQFDTGIDTGTKPFARIAFIKMLHDVEGGSRLVGAPSTHFPLESRLLGDGRYQSTITTLRGDLVNSYFMITFIHDRTGDWPMLIHIPISRIIEQTNANKRKKHNKTQMATPRKLSD